MIKIISGGQSGVDRGALEAALENGIPCGGWCPEGRKAEDGRISEKYPLKELKGGYRRRTLQNVLDSDGTLILYFGSIEGGTEKTLYFCIKHGKPYKLIDAQEIAVTRAVELLREFIERYGISVLNVAGPRASKEAKAQAYAFAVIDGYWRSILHG